MVIKLVFVKAIFILITCIKKRFWERIITANSENIIYKYYLINFKKNKNI